jgi:adenosylmethionine---8-amino-7-oxononanoate aminotransferase
MARTTSRSGAEFGVREFDREHLWHPYTSMLDPLPTRPVVAAEGVRLLLDDGREVVDAMSSWWCAIHGYRHPELDAAVRDQLDRMAHVMFGGLTHAPAVELARRLIDLTPDGLSRVFFADSGSVSVEVAIKMALQHQRGAGRPERHRLLTVRGGYHGDTFGAMSVCDPVTGMHAMFTDVLPPQVFASRPPAGFGADIGAWTDEVDALVAKHRDELAAIIVEPVLQGAGGMFVYEPACLAVLRKLADEHAAVSPDLMCVGKALTGGYLTLAAVLATDEVASSVSASESGVLMHGPTFMANPMACRVAAASIDLLLSTGWASQVARIGAGLDAGLAPAADLPGVVDVRTLGAVGVLEMSQPVDASASEMAVTHGVWLRPFGRLIYTMPPYIVSDEDLAAICTAMLAVAAEGGP